MRVETGDEAFEPTVYRLERRRTPEAILFEFSDVRDLRRVWVARYEVEEPREPGWIARIHRAVFDSRSFSWLALPLALILIPFKLLGILLGLSPRPPRRGPPGLTLEESATHHAILTITQSLGMFYDARKVQDGQGRAVARFRGPSKMSLGTMGFGIEDLGDGDGQDAGGGLPWLGRVAPPEDGVYRFCLVGDPDAGRIVEHRGPNLPSDIPPACPPVQHYDVIIGARLEGNPAGMLLMLAGALALAWRPPAG